MVRPVPQKFTPSGVLCRFLLGDARLPNPDLSTLMLSRFKAPDTTLIIFSIIVLAAVLTWVVPAGEYEKAEMLVEGAGVREVVVPGSFRTVERDFDGVLDRLGHTVAIVLQAPIR